MTSDGILAPSYQKASFIEGLFLCRNPGGLSHVESDEFRRLLLGLRLRRGDVVVLDNLGAHRASRVEEVAEGRGAQVLWLAPYSALVE